MPKTKRTPPHSPQVQIAPEPVLPSATTSKEGPICGVTVRSKMGQGPSGVSSAKTELDEIKCMLHTLIEEQAQKFGKLTNEIVDLKRQNAELQKTNTEIHNWMEFSSKVFEDVQIKLETLERQRKDDREYINVLEQKIKDLDITSRNSILELRNIPANEKESSVDLIKTVCTVGNAIGVEILECNLRDVYRIPSKPGTPKTIVVDFASVQKKDSFLIASKSFNKAKSNDGKLNTKMLGIAGDQLPVYIAEYLPPSMKKLFYFARQFAIQNGYQYCWTVNGKIFLRKDNGSELFRILSEKCFKKLPVKI